MHWIHLQPRCRHDEQVHREYNAECRSGHDDAKGVLQTVSIDDRVHDDGEDGAAGDGGGEVDGARFGAGAEAAEGDGEEEGEDAGFEELAEDDHGHARSVGEGHGQGRCDDHADEEGEQHVAGLDEGVEEGAEEAAGCEDRVSDDLVVEGADDRAAENLNTASRVEWRRLTLAGRGKCSSQRGQLSLLGRQRSRTLRRHRVPV